jgi:hypothetical protein
MLGFGREHDIVPCQLTWYRPTSKHHWKSKPNGVPNRNHNASEAPLSSALGWKYAKEEEQKGKFGEPSAPKVKVLTNINLLTSKSVISHLRRSVNGCNLPSDTFLSLQV